MMSGTQELQSAMEIKGKDIFVKVRGGGVYDRTFKRDGIYLSFVSYIWCWRVIMEDGEFRQRVYSKKKCLNG